MTSTLSTSLLTFLRDSSILLQNTGCCLAELLRFDFNVVTFGPQFKRGPRGASLPIYCQTFVALGLRVGFCLLFVFTL